MKTYATMAKHQPDFFLHSGDTIYADGPMKDEVDFKDGTKWKNVVLVDEKRKVAETLDEYRAQWKYNMLDRHVRELSAVCPTFYQWDDHEVLNNWSDSKDLSKDDRYKEKSIQLLSARAARAFHEMSPIRYMPSEPGRVYRKIAMVLWSMSSSSTCAPIAARTTMRWKQSFRRSRAFWANSRLPG